MNLLKTLIVLFSISLNLIQQLQAQSSVLNAGNWYKINTSSEGIYKITYSDLQNYGINPAAIDPRNIQLFGNGGGMLPQANNAPKTNDLQEVAIKVIGENDGIFNPADYILFYGQSANKWFYDNQNQSYQHQKNLYSDFAYYFLTIGASNGKRINTQNSLAATPNYTSNKYDNLIFYEKDSFNLIKSGREWFGELFDTQLNYTFNYNISNLDLSSTITLNYEVAARSGSTSQIDVSSNSNNSSVSPNVVNMQSNTSRYANLKNATMNFTPSSTTIPITFTYNKPDTNSIAWLNYFELITRNNLTKNNNQLIFKDYTNINNGNITQFRISNTLSTDFVWEITNHNNVVEQSKTFSSGISEFVLSTDSLREFIVFDLSNLLTPNFINIVNNQNLHGVGNPEMVIVTHPNFVNEANSLANFHLSNDGITTAVVTTEEIYNEFSSGAQDITSINNFMEHLYHQSGSNLKYLLLFGDASYDYKNRITPNTNFVPSYQSENSVDMIGSLTSDDYYGLLDTNEGTWTTNEFMDIAIGRLPVKTVQQANDMVNKIIFYKTNTASFGGWRKTITFIADDGDGNTHMAQADNLAEMVDLNNCNFNVEKIYSDEYQQITINNEDSYPDVNQKIINSYRRGSQIINYTGHGGESQLAHENILDTNTIDTLNNSNYPLMITASCETSRYDNPEFIPFGEQFLLHPTAGNIATYSTTRLVFSSPNFILNQDIYNTIFTKVNGKYKTIGEVFKEIKNLNATITNNRNFTLLGDPALTLNFPEYVVNAMHPDTLQSNNNNTITGQIEDDNNVLQSWFNGSVVVLIKSSKDTIITLANDGGSPFVFLDRRDTIFYDTIPITNGTFSFNLNLNNAQNHITGNAKISYYGFNGSTDASGCSDSIYVNDLMTSITPYNPNEINTSLYPNPSSSKVTIQVNGDNDTYTFNLFNNLGQAMLNTKFSKNKFTFLVNNLPNGIYYYRISNNKNQQYKTGKLIIKH